MPLTPRFLAALGVAAEQRAEPFVIPWPMPGNLAAFPSFATFDAWRDFVLGFSVRDGLPQIVSNKFERAQKLYLLAWFDADLIKAGELVAMTALELALKDRYGAASKNKSLHSLAQYMVEHDGLTDAKLPVTARCRFGSVVSCLMGTSKPSLAEIRNGLAHGDPFDGLPWSGLLEVVRDLIDYAYRDFGEHAWPR